MARTQPNQVLRTRIETGIGLAAPLLDLLLAVGDRISRIVAGDDPGHVPARVERPGDHARRSLTLRAPGSGAADPGGGR